ncbi:MAG: gas vesicle protein [Thermoleophilia bacterium]|nr:gas vesicle protein [Thermoleophilia bacterium]
MGLFTGLLLLPLAPVRGTVWIAEQLAAQAERELDDERTVRRLLLDAEAALERGELSEVEYDRIEDELLERLELARPRLEDR